MMGLGIITPGSLASVCTLKYRALVMKRGWDVRMNYFMKEVGGGRPEFIDMEASGT